MDTGVDGFGATESGEVVGKVRSTGALVPRVVITAVGELVSGKAPTAGDGVTGAVLDTLSSETGGKDTGKITNGAPIDGEATG